MMERQHRHLPARRSASGAKALSAASAATAAIVAAAALAGCAAGHDYVRPALPETAGYAAAALPAATASAPVAGGDAQRFVFGKPVDQAWWKLFGSPPLNALVDKAFAANPTVTAAQAALRSAQENVAAQRGFFWPTVQASYQPTRTKIAGNNTGSAPGPQGDGTVIEGPTIYNYHTASLSVSYTADVFGLNRRQVESLESQALYQQLQIDATYMTLAANVTAAAIQEAMLRDQIANTQIVIDSNAQAVELVRRQQKAGYASQLDFSLQESALAQARQQLPPLQKQLDQTRDLLHVLVGDTQDAPMAEQFDLASLTLPTDLPVSLPSQVIEQRPDIRAAEEQLRVASALVGVAKANRLPQFSLDGTWGGEATHFNQMFWSSGLFFNLAGSIVQPIFDGGTLRHREKAAEENYNQAAAQYKSTVLNAYQNIADALHAITADADALNAAVEVERTTNTSLSLIRRQSLQGYVDRLALLTAEQTHRQALLAQSQAQAARMGDTAALFQALGGGLPASLTGMSPVASAALSSSSSASSSGR